jgi:hypothetical protein
MLDAQTPPRKQAVAYLDRDDLASRRYIFLERYMLAKQSNNALGGDGGVRAGRRDGAAARRF